MKTLIVITAQVEGFHRWADCPLLEVAFLRDRHRHIFHIKATKQVSHEDRDIEIILFKRTLQEYLTARFGSPCEFGNLSCESIAAILLNNHGLDSCEVLEDGENGALVVRELGGRLGQ